MSEQPAAALPDAAPPASGSRAPVVFAGLLVLAGVLLVREAFRVPVGNDLISGPRLFPAIITLVFLGLCVAYLVQELAKVLWGRLTDGERVGDWVRVLAMTALTVAYGLALEPVGYLVSTFVLFVVGAWLLGSRAWKRDLVVGLGLSVGIYVVFTQALAVHLPQGVIPLG